MARIPPLPPDEWSDEMRGAIAALRPENPRHSLTRRKGGPKALNALGTLARHPELAKAFNTFNGHVLFASTLSPRQRELLVLRVARLRESEYEWAQHVILAGDVGLDEDEVVRIRRERLTDELVGHVRTVELRGVDVVHAGVDRRAEDRQGPVAVLRWPEDAGPGQLHGPESHPADRSASQLDCVFRHVPGIPGRLPGPASPTVNWAFVPTPDEDRRSSATCHLFVTDSVWLSATGCGISGSTAGRPREKGDPLR